MVDKLIRMINDTGEVRIVAGDMKKTVQEAVDRHYLSAVATAALGRTLIATAMLSVTIKNNEKITVRVMGDGPLGGIVAVANGEVEVKGYVFNPHIELPLNKNGKLDVGRAVGSNGLLHVTKDLNLKQPFTSSVPLVTGEIAEDFTHFLVSSEQTPSVVALGVLVGKECEVLQAGGLFVQVLPGASEQTILVLEKALANFTSITEELSKHDDLVQMVRTLFPEFNLKILAEKDVCYKCSCSKDKLDSILLSLGREELCEALKENKTVEITCHFCNKKYQYSQEEIEGLLNKQNDLVNT